MLAQGRGSIVNVASAAGLIGFRYASAYAASKLWLCSDDSSFITGHALAIDGGTVVA